MKRIFSIWLFLHFASTGITQRGDTTFKYLDSRLEFTNRKNAVYGAVSILSGDHWQLFAVYPDTGVLLKAWFKDRGLTIKDGPFEFFHPGNIPAFKGKYENNVQQGIWQFWYPEGTLKDSGFIRNNRLAGEWKSWYPGGRIKSIAHYPSPEKIPDNPVIMASPGNGKKGFFAKDTVIASPEGDWMEFYENGNKKDSGLYDGGLRTGIWKTWFETGFPESMGTYLKGKQEGEWDYFHENGFKSTHETYHDNRVVSLLCYDQQGHPSGEYCSIQKPAVPILERYVDFNSYALDHIYWPKELDETDVQGIVKLEYTITKEGRLVKLKILESPHELLSKEVIRFFSTLEKWSPAVSHNRVIENTQVFEVPFYR